MNFQPKSEKELQESMLLEPGEYDFEVLAASDEISRKGNPMIKVNLGIYRGEAIGFRLFDYLMAALESKLRHFCDTAGLLAKYESGNLCAQDCIGRSGKVKIGVQEDKTGQYATQNKVQDYVCRHAKPLARTQAESAAPDPTDDVPF